MLHIKQGLQQKPVKREKGITYLYESAAYRWATHARKQELEALHLPTFVMCCSTWQ